MKLKPWQKRWNKAMDWIARQLLKLMDWLQSMEGKTIAASLKDKEE